MRCLYTLFFLLVFFFCLLLNALNSKKKIKQQTEEEYQQKEQSIKASHEEALEKELCSFCWYSSSVCCLIFFLLFNAIKNSTKKIIAITTATINPIQQSIKASHEEALEKERIENKKTVTKQKEDYEATVCISSGRIRFSLTKRSRIPINRISVTYSLWFLENNKIERISHLVLTRTGLYIIDSQLLKGHVYNGISGW
jgi:hypothetical protein